MGRFREKAESTFDINLAPMLDVIVAIVPMLLLSVVFMRVTMVEAQVPQIVAEAIENNKNKPNPVTVALVIDDKGFKFEVTENGKKSTVNVASVNGLPDLDALNAQAAIIKKKHPDIFRVSVKPGKTVSLEKIISTLDNIRSFKNGETVTIKDEKTGKSGVTNLMFPEVVFSDILEG